MATFTQWVDAYAQRDMALAAFYRRRFRAEFAPAVTAWIATRPLQNAAAPLTPFAMPQYHLAARDEAAQLEARADAWRRRSASMSSAPRTTSWRSSCSPRRCSSPG